MSDETCFRNKPIVIDSWRRDDTYEGVYPSGARVKDAYFSPEKPKEKCIKPDWRYLFKLSSHRYPWQFWCEIIAFRFGSVIGVEVPPAHIGLSNSYRDGEATYAALIEWFYDDRIEGYVSGGQIMMELIDNYDRGKGTQHNLSTVLQQTTLQQITLQQMQENLSHWVSILTFDTLIGNIDRHQDNWGIVVKVLHEANYTPEVQLKLSPAFDNGTALGYEIIEKNLHKFNNNDKLKKYLKNRRAKHHMKWSLEDDQELNFYEFMKKITIVFPETKSIIANHLSFTFQQVEEVLSPLVGAVTDPMYKLTQDRLDFVLKLIFRRKEILEETLEL